MFEPGAETSTLYPKFEKLERRSVEAVAPTDNTPLYDVGKKL